MLLFNFIFIENEYCMILLVSSQGFEFCPLVYDMFSSVNFMSAFHVQKQWTELFPWNIGSASTLDIISPGLGGSKNGTLQLVC